MSANLGGTNILRPLQEVLRAQTKEGYPRQLFILTDGEVGNTQECVDFVRKHAETTRVFTFGVGNEASQDLVKGLAKAGVRPALHPHTRTSLLLATYVLAPAAACKWR
jgi:hypothetical protein